jgi:hypothetical protein
VFVSIALLVAVLLTCKALPYCCVLVAVRLIVPVRVALAFPVGLV